MSTHGADDIVKNLSSPCDDDLMAKVTDELGKGLPQDLADLYRVHDGSERESHRFFPDHMFVGLQLKEYREHFLKRYARGKEGILEYAVNWEDWSSAPLYPEEISERWWILGSMDSDYLVMNLDSERIFRARKRWPPLSLVANSIRSFLAHYLERLEKGEYDVTTERFEDWSNSNIVENVPWEVPATDTRKAEAFLNELKSREWIALEGAPSKTLLQRLQIALEPRVSPKSRVKIADDVHVEGVVDVLEPSDEIFEVFATDDQLAEAIAAVDARVHVG